MARPRALSAALALAAAAHAGGPAAAGAQGPWAPRAPGALDVGRPAPELRLDALVARRTAVHLGAGVAWPVGRSVHVGPVVAAGATEVAGRRVASGRAELVARFVVGRADGAGWRYHGAAGAGALLTRGAPGVARVHVALGAEAPARGRRRLGVEAGLGGGVRVGLTLR